MKNGLIFGVAGGIIYVLWFVVFGGIFPNLIYAALPAMGISYTLVTILMFLACRKEQAVLDGSIHFGEAFLVCLATYAFYSLVNNVLVKIYLEFSPTAMATFLEYAKESSIAILEMTNMPEDMIFEEMEKWEEGKEEMLGWKKMFINYAITLIFPGALLALIIAGIKSKLSKQN